MLKAALEAKGFELVPRGERLFSIVPVASQIQPSLLEFATTTAKFLIVLHVLVFFVLVICARWSRRCFLWLATPSARRVGVYFSFAFLHSIIVRTWVLERYFQNIRDEFLNEQDHSYVETVCIRPDESEVQTQEFIEEVKSKPQIWLQGGPGTGKTELVKELMRAYCQERSLRQAWRKYSFIPIYVPLREVSSNTAAALATSAFSRHDFPFEDDRYLKKVLRSGGYLLILDGMNEVSIDDSIREFLFESKRSLRVVITSQSLPINWEISTYRLPNAGPEFALRLVESFLGAALPKEVNRAAPAWRHVRSAFDCQLMASLIRAGHELPETRVGFYQATMLQATADWQASAENVEHPYEVVTTRAFDLWMRTQRRFIVDDRITNEIIAPLLKGGIVVMRGKEYQFVHDLMRGFLAACHLAEKLKSPGGTERALANEEIWALTDAEQDLVFPFLVDLVAGIAELNNIAKAAAQDPVSHLRLLDALASKARREGVEFDFVLRGSGNC